MLNLAQKLIYQLLFKCKIENSKGTYKVIFVMLLAAGGSNLLEKYVWSKLERWCFEVTMTSLLKD